MIFLKLLQVCQSALYHEDLKISSLEKEVENLKAKVQNYEEQLQNLSSEKEKVEKMLRDYQSEVIEKLAIAGDNFDYKKQALNGKKYS